MFLVIKNIYNEKTKRPAVMWFSTATGKLKKFFFLQQEMFDVCITGDTAHIDGTACSSILLMVAKDHHNCLKYTKADVRLRIPDDGQQGCPKHVES
jgi:hypothetical protein